MVYRPLTERHATAMSMGNRLRSLARDQTEPALNIIIGIMNSPTTSDRDKLSAAFGLLDRGWGKPTQLIEATGGEVVRRKLSYEIVHIKEPENNGAPLKEDHGDANGRIADSSSNE
jgi:hypothetical protein